MVSDDEERHESRTHHHGPPAEQQMERSRGSSQFHEVPSDEVDLDERDSEYDHGGELPMIANATIPSSR
jgi:hypothetical protein